MDENNVDDELAATRELTPHAGFRADDGAPGSGRLEVRCPNCHAPSEVRVDTSLTDLTCGSCGSHFSLVDQSKATRMAPPLSQLGRFELVERIGVGGFGSVWKARDKELDRTVAIKIPRQGGMTGEEQEKFFREARAAAQLRHPNIVSVHEVGRDGDSVYIVSDFVRGVTLGDWLSGQQLTTREAAELCATIADALQHAHEQGVVHRDLKPANMMMDYDGRPHLMDFGLARREAGEITMTFEGQVLGTPAYMSPEQAAGEAHSADCRSDIYSVGVILFQLLTGELPFRGNARMLIKQVIHDEPPSPRKLNANISKDLETVTLKCLEKEPNKRYQTARQLSDDLRRFLRGDPISARPIGRIERTWRWCKRNPLVAALSLATLVLLCSGLMITSTLGLVARQQSRAAITNQKRAEKSLYYALMMAVPHQIEQARFATARDMLREAPIQFRSWEWGYFARLCHLDLGTIQEPGRIRAVAFSPDGSRFATAGLSGTCTIYDWPTAKPIHVLTTKSDEVASLAFSPDGRLIVTGQPGTAEKPGGATVWDAFTGIEIVDLAGEPSGVKSVAFSRDGNTVATGGFDGTARLWNARSGAQTMLLEKRTTVVKSLAFSPTQDLLATADKLGDNIVRIWNAADGKLVRELPPEVTGIESLAFSPDGKLLVTGTTRTAQVAIWSTATWRKTQSLPVSYCTWALAFSPDGNHLACGSRESVARICSKRQQSFLESFLSAGGAEWAVTNALKGHSHYVDALAYSPDGRFLLTGSSDRTSKIWSASASRDITELHVPWNATWPYAWALKFTPDNHSIAAATAEDPYIRIWDLHTGAETMRLGPHPTYARSLDVSPDGKLLIAAADGARLWNLSTGECSLLVDQSPPLVEGVAFSPDGKSIAAARGSNAELWDVASKQLIRRIALPDGLLFRIRFSPDGKCLAATTPPTRLPCKLFVWDLGNPANPLFTKSIGDRIDQLAFSPDGQRIAVTSGRAPLVLDSKTGRELLSLGGHVDYVTAFAFSPDGARLVTATVNGSISVWDAADGRELLNLGRTAPWLYAADFSGDGRCFAVGGRRGDNGAGILVLKAFPWDTALSGDDQPAGDEPFAALKRKEFERLLTTSAQPSKTIEYSIKTK